MATPSTDKANVQTNCLFPHADSPLNDQSVLVGSQTSMFDIQYVHTFSFDLGIYPVSPCLFRLVREYHDPHKIGDHIFPWLFKILMGNHFVGFPVNKADVDQTGGRVGQHLHNRADTAPSAGYRHVFVFCPAIATDIGFPYLHIAFPWNSI